MDLLRYIHTALENHLQNRTLATHPACLLKICISIHLYGFQGRHFVTVGKDEIGTSFLGITVNLLSSVLSETTRRARSFFLL